MCNLDEQAKEINEAKKEATRLKSKKDEYKRKYLHQINYIKDLERAANADRNYD